MNVITLRIGVVINKQKGFLDQLNIVLEAIARSVFSDAAGLARECEINFSSNNDLTVDFQQETDNNKFRSLICTVTLERGIE